MYTTIVTRIGTSVFNIMLVKYKCYKIYKPTETVKVQNHYIPTLIINNMV